MVFDQFSYDQLVSFIDETTNILTVTIGDFLDSTRFENSVDDKRFRSKIRTGSIESLQQRIGRSDRIGRDKSFENYTLRQSSFVVTFILWWNPQRVNVVVAFRTFIVTSLRDRTTFVHVGSIPTSCLCMTMLIFRNCVTFSLVGRLYISNDPFCFVHVGVSSTKTE